MIWDTSVKLLFDSLYWRPSKKMTDFLFWRSDEVRHIFFLFEGSSFYEYLQLLSPRMAKAKFLILQLYFKVNLGIRTCCICQHLIAFFHNIWNQTFPELNLYCIWHHVIYITVLLITNLQVYGLVQIRIKLINIYLTFLHA